MLQRRTGVPLVSRAVSSILQSVHRIEAANCLRLAALLLATWPHNALIRPISARYSAGLSLRVSKRSLVSRLDS